jgi:pyruvate/2-oxoglutarate dehydrogenase complex dihydrolipoamide dehydrogenase (E3) component
VADDAVGDFTAMMSRMRRIRSELSPIDSADRFRGLGVDVFLGDGAFTDAATIAVGSAALKFRKAVIATGARPSVPPLPGLQAMGYLTSDTVWSLTQLPRRLVVLGGGPVGCELAQAFARLGAQVVIVQQAERLLPREDPEVSALLRKRFAREGIAVLTNCTALACEEHAGEKTLLLDF